MPNFSDSVVVPLTRPHCGHESQESLTGLKGDPVLTCSSCGEQFKIDSGGSANEVADKLDELQRRLIEAGKTGKAG